SLSDRVVVMSDGRIEQIGTPSEIYNFPSTAFVASFVGTLNLVTAGVVDAGAGRLSIEGQEVRTSKVVSDVPSDRLVPLALRPRGRQGRRDGQRGGRRGGVTVRLDGIDLVVFDKDGTIIEFDAMWSGWAAALAEGLRTATGRSVDAPLFAMLGYDPQSRSVLP